MGHSSERRQRDEIDFKSLIKPVARLLLGDHNEDLSNGKELRYGTFGSLAIDLEKGVWRSHEDKEGGGVIDLIKRETSCSTNAEAMQWLVDHRFIEETRSKPSPPRHKSKPPGEMEMAARYPYRDAEGVVRYEVVRFHFRQPDSSFARTEQGKLEKTFRQRRPHPDYPGGWIDNLDGVELVPYRLPELIGAVAASQRIFIVEGEAKADLLASWGVAATCNPGGAKKWPDSFTQYFISGDVVLLGDNDDSGRQHVDTVGAALANVVTQLAVLELPGLKEKGDLVDWAEAGGTKEKFLKLAAAAAEAKFEEAEAPPPVDSGDGTIAPAFSDEYLALRFAHLHQRSLRYVVMWGQWMCWRGTAWARDDILKAFDQARKLCREVANESDNPSESKGLASAKTVAAVERLARADPRLSTAVEQWDDKPDQFNTPTPKERRI